MPGFPFKKHDLGGPACCSETYTVWSNILNIYCVDTHITPSIHYTYRSYLSMETHAMKLLHTVFMLMLIPEEVLTYSIISVLDFDALFVLGDLLCNILCGVPFCGQVLWFLNTSILQYYSLQLIVEYLRGKTF